MNTKQSLRLSAIAIRALGITLVSVGPAINRETSTESGLENLSKAVAILAVATF